jgi:hypothetical protein
MEPRLLIVIGCWIFMNMVASAGSDWKVSVANALD